MIVIVGATLAGMAAAARLARVNHRVVLLDRRPAPTPFAARASAIAEGLPPGGSPRREGRPSAGAGRWPGGLDADPDVIALPAAWRDLFKKSGRPLDAELGWRGLSLVPAPPARHLTPAGELVLPDERASQWHTLVAAFGPQLATAWRDLLDQLDDTWLTLRPLGVEAEFTATRLDRATRTALRTGESLADLAGRVGPLGTLFTDLAVRRDSDPRRAPGWLGTRISLERNFGRWQLVDDGQTPRPATDLVDLLLERLTERGVEFGWTTEVHRVATGRVATDRGELACRAAVVTTSPWRFAALTGQRAPRRLRAAGTAGPRWRNWRTLLDLPRLQSTQPGVYAASEFSPAGPEAWAQLLTGALAAYRVHQDLTGQDMRPTNKAWRPPRFQPPG
ncbi:MAG: NAD(P)-binding protein [Propionicimonas sp.]